MIVVDVTQQRIHGYVLCMITQTGIWYYSGVNTLLPWTQDIQSSRVLPGFIVKNVANRLQAEITDVFGASAIIGKIDARPVGVVEVMP